MTISILFQLCSNMRRHLCYIQSMGSDLRFAVNFRIWRTRWLYMVERVVSESWLLMRSRCQTKHYHPRWHHCLHYELPNFSRLLGFGSCLSTLLPTMLQTPMSLWGSFNINININKTGLPFILANIYILVLLAQQLHILHRWAWRMGGWTRRRRLSMVLITLSGEPRLVSN